MASPLVDVYVKLTTGRVVTYEMMPSTTVTEIYKKVAEEEMVPDNRVVLRYTGKIVKRQHTIEYLGICKETILKSQVLTLRSMTIFVKTEKGCTIPMTLNNLTTLAEVKDRIQSQEGTAPHLQTLKHSKVVLQPNSESLENLGIKDEDVITLTTREVTEERTAPTEENDELDEDTLQELLNNFAADLTSDKAVEVVFSFDTTGSMYSCLQQVRDKLEDAVRKLLKDIPKIRIGILAHGDYCDYDKYVIKTCDLSSDVDQLVKFVNDVPRTGGGDSPECYEWVLRCAQRLDWSQDSAKALVVIGDDLPHPVSYTDQNVNWHEELVTLKEMSIKVYGVKAQNNSYSTPFYEEIADQTGGAYIQFKHFSVITDMFLAVCYKESGEEQLNAFCEEVKTEGRMTEDMAEIFQQLEEKPKTDDNGDDGNNNDDKKGHRYVNASWWDPSLDHGSVQYCYNAKTDKWMAPSRKSSPSARSTPSSSSTTKSISSPTTFHSYHGKADGFKTSKQRFSLRKSRSSRAYSSPATASTKKCVIQ
ncbi:uncharacterized protein [Ptychodera flava]|uniref:uncharacterized protein n=1 Tax=Ptychodera flava TaxID=63121 RepID=UPI003969F874